MDKEGRGGEEVAWQEEQSAGCRPASRQYPSLTPGIPTASTLSPWVETRGWDPKEEGRAASRVTLPP